MFMSSTAPPARPPTNESEVIRLERFVNCFSQVTDETILQSACSNTSAHARRQRARARGALPFRRRRGVSGTGRSIQRSRVRVDCPDRAGSVARRGSRSGRVPAPSPRTALLPRRSTALDMDLSDRRERLRAGTGAPARAGSKRLARRQRVRRACRRRRPIDSSAIWSCAIGWKAIARLPANYRLLIAAHYLDGVYEDLAEALQLPLGTVKTQLFRAKQRCAVCSETELK